MQLNLKLSHKGLILISVPLIFQLIFVFVLAGLLAQAQQQEKLAERGQRIVSRLGNVSKHIIESEMALLFYVMKKNPVYKQEYEFNDQQIPIMFNELKKLTSDMPNVNIRVRKFELYADHIRHELRSTIPDLEHGNSMYALPKIANLTGNYYFSVKKEIEEITRGTRYRTSVGEIQDSKNQLIWKALVFSIVFNIGLTIALALIFSKNITERLSILSENAGRVRDKIALNPPIDGHDEIAQLDTAFHSMSEALIRAETAKAEFISMISHDLRSPLTSLQGTLALAEKGSYGELNEKGKARFLRAEKTVERLVKLINELLDIEKLEAGMLTMSLSEELLDPIIERSIESVSTLAENKHIKIEATATSLNVLAEPDRLVQVFVNLLSNAIKFSPEGSTISITATVLATGVKVIVADQGRGIPQDVLLTIFDRFQQVRKEDATTHGGTGLGLTITKAIIEGHGGIIGVDSEEGTGTQFWFLLQKV